MQGVQVTPWSWVSQANMQYWWKDKTEKLVWDTHAICNEYTNVLAKTESEAVKRKEIILSFLRFHPSTAFWTLWLIMMAPPFLLRVYCPQ